MLKKYGVKINYNCRVSDVIVENKHVKGISVDESALNCDSVILATGGVSYPTTGSTGDGYEIAKKLGHTIIEPFPSLVPIVTYENVRELMGLTLKNVKVSAFFGEKLIREEFGEIT